MSLIKLSVRGISYSQTQSGAYALILSEESGTRKLPIIIAKTEAQSISIALEANIKPPRPLTHDLFKNFADKFGIVVKEVIIHKLIDGVFFSSLVCVKDDKEVLLDSRTSDAVALAIRFNAPIYTYKMILDQAGINLNIEKQKPKAAVENETEFVVDLERVKEEASFNLADLSVQELERLLEVAIEEENYEEAAKLRDEIEKRK